MLELAALLLALQEPALPAGHSAHGEAFNEGPRQAAYVREGMGRVVFPVTTKSPEAQKFFTQGVGQLHGFYYFEAERSFRQAAALDPDLAMAYWGMAMANVNNEKRAKGFVEKAVQLRPKAGPREQKWIDLLSAYTKESAKEKRARGYVKALEGLVHDDPDDLEAKAFLAWACWFFKDKGLPIQSHQAVDAILSEIFAKEPMHPAHHYRIHLWDEEKKDRAVGSAEKYGPSQPGIAHAWHMPGHIYSKLQRYSDAAWQQEASARVDHASMIFDRTMPYQIHNYAHNNQWLAQTLGHVGQAKKGIAVAENLAWVPRHPTLNKPESSGHCVREGRSRLVEIAMRWELWDDILSRQETTLAKIEARDDSIRRLKAIGTAHAMKGDVASAKRTVAALEELGGKEPEKKADEKKPAETTAEAKPEENKEPQGPEEKKETAKKSDDSKSRAVRPVIEELSVLIALAEGDSKKAQEHLAKASTMDKTAEARAWLRAGDKDKAEKKAKEAADGAKNQASQLAAYVEILFEIGKKDEAAAQFKKLQELAQEADPDLPVLRRLEKIAGPVRLPGWTKKTTATPGGPTLDSLGPLTWAPARAPGFTLLGAKGDPHRLDAQPTLLIFYLGARCSHCVEQLKKFSGEASGFREAGISILAISTESPEQMKQAASPPCPFPLLADPALRVFKEYRCHDDFEKASLHGTFLIDAKGRIRWQEIAHTPFMEASWLLGECRRLLAD